MAFARELEDFAQAFSQGYSMVRSPQEKQQEELRIKALQQGIDLQAAQEQRASETYQHELERRPVVEGQQDQLFGLSLKDKQLGIEKGNAELQGLTEYNSPENVALRRRTSEAAAAKSEAEAAKAAWEADPANLAKKQAYDDAVARNQNAQAAAQELQTMAARPEALMKKKLGDMFLQGGGDISTTQSMDEPASAVDASPMGGPRGLRMDYEDTPGPRKNIGLSQVADDSAPPMVISRAITNGTATKKDMASAGRQAMKEGLNYAANYTGANKQTAVDSPEQEQAQAQFLTGGYGDPEAGQMILDSVNEASGGNMPYNEQLLNGLGSVWAFYNATGEPEKAQRAAAGMIGFYKQMASQYMAVAKAAASNGDMDTATEALARAYIHAAPGDKMEFKEKDGKYQVTVTDVNGKKKTSKVMSPDEIGGMIMKVTPADFLPMMMSASGVEDKTISDDAAKVLAKEYPNLTAAEISKMTPTDFARIQAAERDKAKANKPMTFTPEEVDHADSVIEDAIGKLSPEVASELKLDDPNSGIGEDLAPVAAQIYLRSKGAVNGSRALQAARHIIVDGPDELVELPNNEVMVHVKGIKPFTLSADDYAVLISHRAEFSDKFGPPTEGRKAASSSPAKTTQPAATSSDSGSILPTNPATDEDWRKPFWTYPGFFQSNPAVRPQTPSGATTQAVPVGPPSNPIYQPPASIIPQNDTPWYWRMFNN